MSNFTVGSFSFFFRLTSLNTLAERNAAPVSKRNFFLDDGFDDASIMEVFVFFNRRKVTAVNSGASVLLSFTVMIMIRFPGCKI